jgi:hypothetical protein
MSQPVSGRVAISQFGITTLAPLKFGISINLPYLLRDEKMQSN